MLTAICGISPRMRLWTGRNLRCYKTSGASGSDSKSTNSLACTSGQHWWLIAEKMCKVYQVVGKF